MGQKHPKMDPKRTPNGTPQGTPRANIWAMACQQPIYPKYTPQKQAQKHPILDPLQLLLSINYTGCHHLDQPQSWIETGFWTGIKQLIQLISSHYTAVHTCTYVPISLPTRYTATSAQPLNQLSQLPSTSYPYPIQTQNGPKIAEIQYNPPFRPYLSYILAPMYLYGPYNRPQLADLDHFDTVLDMIPGVRAG